ncbi:hypothetical protein DL93DRAFT_2082335 [Clavulina sp. PMI_390]|nr:hypothetical protein DL93DRAFT_2082335 [Clavulina sp. PMI_390]
MSEGDSVWSSSSARQIRALGNVEKEVAELLQQAARMLERQRIPALGEHSLTSEEWNDMIVKEATAYFDKLDSIQGKLRRVLLDMRTRRMTPASLNLAATTLGSATLPASTPKQPTPPSSFLGEVSGPAPPRGGDDLDNMNFQEARLERDAWRGISDALEKLSNLRKAHAEALGTNGNVPSESDVEESSDDGSAKDEAMEE